MIPDMIADTGVMLLILSGFLSVLAVGALVADYILPHIPPLARWIDSLPMIEEDDDDEEGEAP